MDNTAAEKTAAPRITIAIDGFSSSGKSTMAKQLAAKIGYAYIDSGAMYRAVTLYALEHGLIAPDGSIDIPALLAALPSIDISFRPDPETGASLTLLNGRIVEQEIRTLRVSNHVSPIAAIPEVRHRLVALQQALGREKGIVMDGRDIGTTVFPDAELKIFVNASAEARARRRFLELTEKGQNPSYPEVYKNICERDHIDSTRKESPLRRADDAIDLDNDNLTREEQLERILQLYRNTINRLADGPSQD